ncbi:MAG TPA: hypothetical protein DEP66_04090, partial [Acidimicrobiaceae bacterium]|nr:hypothetical protein [Acidimicrobiaceae bacterium]HCB37385.1 hypothetical protein [Acidimicrobiaceae bacterium]
GASLGAAGLGPVASLGAAAPGAAGPAAPGRLAVPDDIAYEWIDTAAALAGFAEHAAAADRIAVDTEFHRERTYWPQLALVQIAAGDRLALVDPTAVDLAPLAGVVSGGALTVMHAGEQDLEMLQQACGTIPARLFDTQIAAGFVGMSTPSLTSLLNRFTKHRLSKGDRLADWLHRPLTKAQLRYAASDVAHLFELTDRLTDDLGRRGRLQWALDECELSRRPPPPPIEPELAWSRLKQARRLQGEARTVACAVAAWRERTARSRDIPPRFVMSDLALLSVAQRAPRSVDDMKSLRGVQFGSKGGSGAEAVLEAVRHGLEMSPDDVPRPPASDVEQLDSDLRPAATLVGAWLDQLARRNDLDRALLATRRDVDMLLAGSADSRLSSGWRADLVGGTVDDLVAGRAALAFDPGHGLATVPLAETQSPAPA